MKISSDEQLEGTLANIPAGAHCVVEGGHLTARIRHLQKSSGRRRLAGQKDQCYLVAVADHPDPLPCEILRGSVEVDHSQWAIVRPAINEVIELPGRLTSAEHIYTVKYHPSETQKRSLGLALDIVRQLADKVERVCLAILIGDLEVPPSLRQNLMWAFPEEYRDMVDSLPDKVHVYSEAACQAAGKGILDPLISVFENHGAAERIYKDQGYTLFCDGRSGSFNISSDYALQTLREFPHLVAVTKDSSTPTCGLILAGKLLTISKGGFTHFLSVYDRADDARIRRKNVDGFLIFSYMVHDHYLDAVLITSNTVGSLAQMPEIDSLSSKEIKVAGSLSGVRELLDLTARRNLDPGLEFVDAMSAPSCCTY